MGTGFGWRRRQHSGWNVKTTTPQFAWFALKVFSTSFDRVSPSLQTGGISPVVIAAFLRIGRSLLLLGLRLLPPALPGLHSTNHGAADSTCGRSLAGVVIGDFAHHGADCRASRRAPDSLTLGTLALRGGCLSRRLRLHGIETRLLLGPPVALVFVFLHLLLGLPLGRVNDQILT